MTHIGRMGPPTRPSGKPITPEEARDQKTHSIPDFVINLVNQLIIENLGSHNTAIIKQSDVIKRLSQVSDDIKQSWLDFEPLFRENGWNVVYDKPGYNEDYEANYKFSPKTNN